MSAKFSAFVYVGATMSTANSPTKTQKRTW